MFVQALYATVTGASAVDELSYVKTSTKQCDPGRREHRAAMEPRRPYDDHGRAPDPQPTQRTYRRAAVGLVEFLEQSGQLVAPGKLTRRHIESYMACLIETRSSS